MYVGADRHQADDAVSSALVYAVRNWARVKTKEDPFRYVCRAAINYFLKEKKRGLCRRTVSQDSARSSAGSGEGRPVECPGAWHDARYLRTKLSPRHAAALSFQMVHALVAASRLADSRRDVARK
jgi:hypothetical protein